MPPRTAIWWQWRSWSSATITPAATSPRLPRKERHSLGEEKEAVKTAATKEGIVAAYAANNMARLEEAVTNVGRRTAKDSAEPAAVAAAAESWVARPAPRAGAPNPYRARHKRAKLKPPRHMCEENTRVLGLQLEIRMLQLVAATLSRGATQPIRRLRGKTPKTMRVCAAHGSYTY